jgi:hypothetical protein
MALKHKTHQIDRVANPQRQTMRSSPPADERDLNPAHALPRPRSLHPSALTPADVLTRQRTVGNRVVQRLLRNQPGSVSSLPSTSPPVRQRQPEEEEPVQGKFEISAPSENKTGLPDHLKTGVENLSGLPMDDVRVHYNSPKPAQVQAQAYTQGTDIHLGPDEEEHLPHEAWHVVQQKQGRVKPTLQAKGMWINADEALEREADLMEAKPWLIPHGQEVVETKERSIQLPQSQSVVQSSKIPNGLSF